MESRNMPLIPIYSPAGGDGGDGSFSSFKGHYLTEAALIAAYPVGEAGWYAIVDETNTVWVWSTEDAIWKDSSIVGTVTGVNGITGEITIEAGDGIIITTDLLGDTITVTNSDRGSTAVEAHELDETAHPANHITYDPSGNDLTATDVQGAIDELEGIVDGLPLDDYVLKAGDTMTGPLAINADNAALSVTRADSGGNFIDFNRTGAGGYRFHAASAGNNVASWRVSGPDGSNVSMRAFRSSNGFSGETWATGGGIDSQGAGVEFNHDTQDMAIYANNILARAPLHMRLNDPIYYRGDANTDGSVRISSPSASTILIEQRTDGIWEEIEIGGGIGGLDWGIYNTNQTAESGKGYLFDTSTTRTLTLPATPEEGTEIGIGDYTGQAETNNITVLRNGSNIEGQTEDLAINVDQAVFNLVYTDATVGWKIAYTNVAGDGDVVGPESSTDNAITRFDGTTGKLIQNSSATLDDSGNISVTGLQFGSGQAVDTIETTLTDDDTHIPTSGAVFDAIDGVTGVEYVSAPATPTSTGTQGQFAYSGNYLYVCVATDTWIRTSAESTWS